MAAEHCREDDLSEAGMYFMGIQRLVCRTGSGAEGSTVVQGKDGDGNLKPVGEEVDRDLWWFGRTEEHLGWGPPGTVSVSWERSDES